MGYDAACTLHFDGRTTRGKAFLEQNDLIFRGPLRLAIPLKDITSAVAGDGALTVSVVMHLGADGLWRQFEWGTSSVLTQGWIDRVRYACGRAWHVPSVEVALAERWLRVPVNTHGWWLFMAYADEDVALNLSRVPDPLT